MPLGTVDHARVANGDEKLWAPSCGEGCRNLNVKIDGCEGRSLIRRSAGDTHIPLAMARYVVFGHVVGVHIDDRFIVNGRLDTAAMRPIARYG